MVNKERRMKEGERWHVSKTINIGHLLTTIGAVAALFIFANKFDQRMTILEVNQHNISVQQERDRNDNKDLLKEMRVDIKNILEKLVG